MAKKRIMIVEDESVTAMDLKFSLIQLGYEVPAVVSRGEEAERTAAEARPDLVLMDITLSGSMSGIQAADEIWTAHAIPVVFLTAHADAETIGRAKITEPFGYLPKPCSIDTLISTIEVALFKGEADARRREAENNLKRVMEEQKIILDNIGVGVLFTIYSRVIWTNDSLLDMFGYSFNALDGKDIELLFPDRTTYEKIEKEGHAAIARGEIFTGEIPMKRRNGTAIWCQLIGQAVNPDNFDEGSIWLIEDVTRRRLLEEALRKSEKKYRTVADFTSDWEFWIGPDERILYSSPSCEKITGYSASMFEQDPYLLRRIIHPDDDAVYRKHHHGMIAQDTSEEIEFRIVRPDGSIRWISHVCRPVIDDQGRFTGTRGSNRDITSRKTAEQERERLIGELREALAKVKALSGMLPICASCKKIRDDRGYWKQIEAYISDHSEAEFSHGICPDCAKSLYGKYFPEDEGT